MYTHHGRTKADETTLLARILPTSVATAEAFADDDPPQLLGGEADAVSCAVEPRRREFATARRCARDALAHLGVPAVALPRAPDGSPSWPPGVVGSITHCAGYRAAATARASGWYLGVDAEPHRHLPPRVLGSITTGREAEVVRRLSQRSPRVCWDRMLLCAKEAVYKAWFPLAGEALGFDDAVVALHEDGTFDVRLVDRTPPVLFHGTWHAEAGLLLAAVVAGRTLPSE